MVAGLVGLVSPVLRLVDWCGGSDAMTAYIYVYIYIYIYILIDSICPQINVIIWKIIST